MNELTLLDLMRLPLYGPGSSFMEVLKATAPELLTRRLEGVLSAPEGTTVLALRCRPGVVMAGDRRATEGFQIAHRSIEKVFAADSHSAVAIAGAAGPALEMVRLLQTELEHYEKVEGERLSLEGEADYHATGSGGKDARSSLKKRYRDDLERDDAVKFAIEALFDAADEDVGTGGPHLMRGSFPKVGSISQD